MSNDDEPAFTEKQLSVGKKEFERRLAGLRKFAYGDVHPVLTFNVMWEVAYVDSVFAEVERLRGERASYVAEIEHLLTDRDTALKLYYQERERRWAAEKLTGNDLGDSGMGEPGGVSDGPQ